MDKVIELTGDAEMRGAATAAARGMMRFSRRILKDCCEYIMEVSVGTSKLVHFEALRFRGIRTV
jgi:hypothetical protein